MEELKNIQPVLCRNEKVIAGPCSAESYEQVMDTAKQLYEQGVTIFRAGIWKPRTQPGGFEGIGTIAIPWLKEVKDRYGMKIAIEVANETQATIALNNDIDILWIGARTTADPFAVQSIANVISLAKSIDPNKDISVLIKNPVCPDYNLWLGAIQRIANTGITKIGCVFRGFKTYKKSIYRNEPIWAIPLQLMTEHPNIQMILDPSHITGDRKLINKVVREGLRIYNMDGVMIECHCDPDNAWTDSKQQIKPENLASYLDISNFNCNMFTGDVSDMNDEDKKLLNNYRAAIEKTDEKIVNLIVTRLSIAQMIGKLKAKYNIPVLRKDQWKKIIENVKNQLAIVVNENFNPYENSDDINYFISTMMENIYDEIHNTSIKIQEENNIN